MDPNLFHLDWERVFEVLVTIVILSFLMERALAVFFETRIFISKAAEKSVKEFLAVIVGAIICIIWKFDAFSMILLQEKTTIFGAVMTGAVIAGGSKASIRLFRDVLEFRSSAESERQAKLKKRIEGGGPK
jgi:hypothetical protein